MRFCVIHLFVADNYIPPTVNMMLTSAEKSNHVTTSAFHSNDVLNLPRWSFWQLPKQFSIYIILKCIAAFIYQNYQPSCSRSQVQLCFFSVRNGLVIKVYKNSRLLGDFLSQTGTIRYSLSFSSTAWLLFRRTLLTGRVMKHLCVCLSSF